MQVVVDAECHLVDAEELWHARGPNTSAPVDAMVRGVKGSYVKIRLRLIFKAVHTLHSSGMGSMRKPLETNRASKRATLAVALGVVVSVASWSVRAADMGADGNLAPAEDNGVQRPQARQGFVWPSDYWEGPVVISPKQGNVALPASTPLKPYDPGDSN